MKTTLICPDQTGDIECLTESCSPVCLPMLGETVLSCWLGHLAARQTTHVTILARQDQDQIREICGDGSRWGLEIEIVESLNESASGATLMDHLPGMADMPLFESYANYFQALSKWLPRMISGSRLHLKEIRPQVWAGQRTRVSSSARLIGPCWLGDFVEAGKNSVIGPNAYLENHVSVGEACEVRESWIGPETFLGNLTGLQSSLAWGNRLINWKTNSHTVVPDAFLMCSLAAEKPRKGLPGGQGSKRAASPSLVERWSATLAMAQKSQG